MNRNQTMLASIVAVAVVGAVLMVSGVIDVADAKQTETSRFSQSSLGAGVSPNEVQKIIVEITSPYGYEEITSFRVFQTSNLMEKTGYHTLRLQGPIMEDKLTLGHWIASELGRLPEGYVVKGVTANGMKEAAMSSFKDGAESEMIPMKGKVRLLLLPPQEDIRAYGQTAVRDFEFSGCNVAGYYMGTLAENEKPYFKDGIQHYEEVVFACTDVRTIDISGLQSRGIYVERAINNDDRRLTNEKGELIITSGREYRQPIVPEQDGGIESTKVRSEIVTRIQLDKTNYSIGDSAVFTVTFTNLEGNPVEPDTIRSIYDGKMVALQKIEDDDGAYVFATPPLLKEHHQLIVSVDKSGFPTDTTYMSIPIHRIS